MILLDQSGAAAKESKLFSPSRSLASFVEHFWVQQTLSGPIGPSWRVIPEANPNLIKGRGDVCDMGVALATLLGICGAQGWSTCLVLTFLLKWWSRPDNLIKISHFKSETVWRLIFGKQASEESWLSMRS